jgi:hypothetical protein
MTESAEGSGPGARLASLNGDYPTTGALIEREANWREAWTSVGIDAVKILSSQHRAGSIAKARTTTHARIRDGSSVSGPINARI